jgi:hypothetical protein
MRTQTIAIAERILYSDFMNTSYLSPKLEARPRPDINGMGVFAKQPVSAGELLTVWGGRIMDLDTLNQLPAEIVILSIQVEEGLYLAPSIAPEPADYFNHSCDPNAGLSGQIALVALRDIAPEEEICFDYATCDGSIYADDFHCACGSPNCRGRVSSEDWRDPGLQKRYAGHFMPYLQRRIDRLNQPAEA